MQSARPSVFGRDTWPTLHTRHRERAQQQQWFSQPTGGDLNLGASWTFVVALKIINLFQAFYYFDTCIKIQCKILSIYNTVCWNKFSRNPFEQNIINKVGVRRYFWYPINNLWCICKLDKPLYSFCHCNPKESHLDLRRSLAPNIYYILSQYFARCFSVCRKYIFNCIDVTAFEAMTASAYIYYQYICCCSRR